LTLKQPYSPFLENTTLGILPKHIWSGVNGEEFQFSQFNIEPIGSGPFKLKTVERNASGIPLYYRLEAFTNYTFGSPLIKNLIIRFYRSNTDVLNAYDKGSVDGLANISPQQAGVIKNEGGRVEQTPLPRIFAVFFNQIPKRWLVLFLQFMAQEMANLSPTLKSLYAYLILYKLLPGPGWGGKKTKPLPALFTCI